MDNEYTPVRRFYAWVGFITILALQVAFVTSIVWSSMVLAANGY